MSGAFIRIGTNTTLVGTGLTFVGGRALHGGCISIYGFSEAYFENTTFESCSALTGGAIYAVDFNSLVVKKCSFKNNIVFKGYGQNIRATNAEVNLTLVDSSFQSYHNSIFFVGGSYLYSESCTFTSEALRVESAPY